MGVTQLLSEWEQGRRLMGCELWLGRTHVLRGLGTLAHARGNSFPVCELGWLPLLQPLTRLSSIHVSKLETIENCRGQWKWAHIVVSRGKPVRGDQSSEQERKAPWAPGAGSPR